MNHSIRDKVSIASLLSSLAEIKFHIDGDANKNDIFLTSVAGKSSLKNVLQKDYFVLEGFPTGIDTSQAVLLKAKTPIGLITLSVVPELQDGMLVAKLPSEIQIEKARFGGRLQTSNLDIVVLITQQDGTFSSLLRISDFSRNGMGGTIQFKAKEVPAIGDRVSGCFEVNSVLFNFSGQLVRVKKLNENSKHTVIYDIGVQNIEFTCKFPSLATLKSPDCSPFPVQLILPQVHPDVERGGIVNCISMNHLEVILLDSEELKSLPSGFPIKIRGLEQPLIFDSFDESKSRVILKRLQTPFVSFEWLKFYLKIRFKNEFALSAPRSADIFSDFFEMSSGFSDDKKILQEIYKRSIQDSFNDIGENNPNLLRILFRGGQNQYSGHITNLRIGNRAFCTSDIVSFKSSLSEFSREAFRTYFLSLYDFFNSISEEVTDNWIIEQDNKKWDIFRNWLATPAGSKHLNFRLPMINKNFVFGQKIKLISESKSDLIERSNSSAIKDIRTQFSLQDKGLALLDVFDFNYENFAANKMSELGFSRKYLHIEISNAFHYLVILTSRPIGSNMGRIFDSAIVLPINAASLAHAIESWQSLAEHTFYEAIKNGVHVYRVILGDLNLDLTHPGKANRELWSMTPEVYSLLGHGV